jgi:hypothetical protein
VTAASTRAASTTASGSSSRSSSDVALARAIADCPSRRYPTYWVSLGRTLTEPARRLIAKRDAAQITIGSADEFFVDLNNKIARLDQRAARRGRPAALRSHRFALPRTAHNPGWVVGGTAAAPSSHRDGYGPD